MKRPENKPEGQIYPVTKEAEEWMRRIDNEKYVTPQEKKGSFLGYVYLVLALLIGIILIQIL